MIPRIPETNQEILTRQRPRHLHFFETNCPKIESPASPKSTMKSNFRAMSVKSLFAFTSEYKSSKVLAGSTTYSLKVSMSELA